MTFHVKKICRFVDRPQAEEAFEIAAKFLFRCFILQLAKFFSVFTESIVKLDTIFSLMPKERVGIKKLKFLRSHWWCSSSSNLFISKNTKDTRANYSSEYIVIKYEFRHLIVSA